MILIVDFLQHDILSGRSRRIFLRVCTCCLGVSVGRALGKGNCVSGRGIDYPVLLGIVEEPGEGEVREGRCNGLVGV